MIGRRRQQNSKVSGRRIIKKADSTLQKASTPNSSCWRRSNSTSPRLSTGPACTPETYAYSIILMGMMSELEVTDQPHQKDDLHVQNAQGLCDYGERFWPFYWKFIGAGEESLWKYYKIQKANRKWDRKTLQILHTHPVVAGTTILNKGSLKQTETTTSTLTRARSTPA